MSMPNWKPCMIYYGGPSAATAQSLYQSIIGKAPTVTESLSTQNISHWDINKVCNFKGRAYQEVSITRNSYTSCLAEKSNYCNAAYQVDMTILKGDGGGLIFRNSSSGSYRWRISPDSTYDLVASPGTVLLQGSISTFKQGLKAVNHLLLIAQGNTIYLYVNGAYVGGVNDSSSACGKVGFLALMFSRQADVAFQHLTIWTL